MNTFLKMPPPCGVEFSRSLLHVRAQVHSGRCHPLAGWSLTLVATLKRMNTFLEDATPLRGGVSRSLLQKRTQTATRLKRGFSGRVSSKRETPPRKGVASPKFFSADL